MKTITFVAFLSIFGAISCGKRPLELRVLNWSDYIGKQTIASFEKECQCHIVYDTYASNEELLAKLLSGAKYDVIFPSGYMLQVLKSKGLVRTLAKDQIPNRKNVMQEFAATEFDPKAEYSMPYTWSTTGIGYDDRVVSADQTRSIDLIFTPPPKARLLLLDDMRAVLGIALKSLGFSANSRDPKQVSEAAKKILSIKRRVHTFASANIPGLLANGDVNVAYGWSGDILQAKARNPHIRYAIPSEGTLMYVDFMAIPTVSANPELASRFINHILEPKVASEVAETIRYAVANREAKLLVIPEVRELWSILEAPDAMHHFEYVKNLDDALGLYDQAWQQIKSSNVQ